MNKFIFITFLALIITDHKSSRIKQLTELPLKKSVDISQYIIPIFRNDCGKRTSSHSNVIIHLDSLTLNRIAWKGYTVNLLDFVYQI